MPNIINITTTITNQHNHECLHMERCLLYPPSLWEEYWLSLIGLIPWARLNHWDIASSSYLKYFCRPCELLKLHFEPKLKEGPMYYVVAWSKTDLAFWQHLSCISTEVLLSLPPSPSLPSDQVTPLLRGSQLGAGTVSGTLTSTSQCCHHSQRRSRRVEKFKKFKTKSNEFQTEIQANQKTVSGT